MSIEKENRLRYESNVNIYKCYTCKFGHLPSQFRKLHRENQIEIIHIIIFRINKNSYRVREKWHTMSSSWRQTGSEAQPKRRTRTLSMVSLMIASTSCFFVSTVNRLLNSLQFQILGFVCYIVIFFRPKITYKKYYSIIFYYVEEKLINKQLIFLGFFFFSFHHPIPRM